MVVLFFLALAALGVFVWGGRPGQAPPAEAVQLPAVEQHRPVSRPAEPAEAMPQVAITPVARSNPPDSSGMYVAAARTDGHDHIWAHNPETGEHFQLTHGEWDDRDPAISPDLRTLAFSSNRTGNWDLLLMDLQSGNIRQLTDTPGFEGSPTWSPDSRWLAYEALYSDNFDIWILPIDGSQQAIQLTSHQSADHAPAWSPDGRKVAFTSDRTGLSDVYLADLDRPSAGFTNITNSAELVESVPAFDPLGDLLAYGVETSGLRGIQLMDLASGEPSWIGEGSSPAWIGDGEQVAAIALAPYGSRVVSYALREGGPKVSPVFAGRLSGLQWAPFLLPAYVVPGEMKSDLRPEAVLSNSTSAGGRLALIGLEDIAPAGLELSDSTDEAFYALRARAAELAGWDFLGQLDYAFVGVNDPLPPGFAYNDWLYTGRAFSVGQAALQAGWLEIVREDFGTTTYWRLFVRANSHEGDLGAPLKVRPWDLTARFSEDSTSYDSGGAPKAAVPSGYYIDFTALAADFGFERVPALSNWRSFFPGARTGEYVLREGLDWITAMKDLYPASAIETPAPYQTPTPTPTITPRPTATPWWWQWRTPTPTVPTATPTLTSTATPTP